MILDELAVAERAMESEFTRSFFDRVSNALVDACHFAVVANDHANVNDLKLSPGFHVSRSK